jgi:hypothetical protein
MTMSLGEGEHELVPRFTSTNLEVTLVPVRALQG